MKILVLCSDTEVRVGAGTGAALHLRAITSAFAALGHQTEVVGVGAAPDQPLEPWDVPQHLVPYPERTDAPLCEARQREVVERVAEAGIEAAARLRPQLVYERLSPFGTAGLRVAATSGVRHVVEVNALPMRRAAGWQGGAEPTPGEDALAGADLRVAVSEQVAAEVRLRCGDSPLVVVPNGVDIKLFGDRPDPAPTRACLGLPVAARLLCFTGSLRHGQGIDVAVEAMAALPHDVHLVVAGDGPMRQDLASRAHALGLHARIHWLGQVAHAAVPGVLAACDVALAPYPATPDFGRSPLKLYEYLAAGIPVVASSIGQIVHATDGGRWGCLVHPGDPVALAAGVADVLRDPAVAAERAERARLHALAENGWTNRAQRILSATASLAGHSLLHAIAR